MSCQIMHIFMIQRKVGAGRMGRPRRDGSKTARIEIHISAEEEQMLNDLSDLTGESKSDIIRKGIKMSYNLEKYNEKGRDIF